MKTHVVALKRFPFHTPIIERLEDRVAPATIVFPNPSDLEPAFGFQINGEGQFQRAGSDVTDAGDINGDGFDDIIIAAPGKAAYVVFGKATPFTRDFDLSSVNGVNGFRIVKGGGAAFGFTSVSGAGDVNDDGFDDVIIGGSGGGASVIYGKASRFPTTFALTSLNGTNGFRLEGEGFGGGSSAVAAAGDINGDGVDDFITTAPNADVAFERSGAAYIIYGKDRDIPGNTFPTVFSLSSLNGANGYRLVGESAFDGDQMVAAAAGDVNSDGKMDFIVSAPGAEFTGRVYVIFGKAADATASMSLSALTGANGFRFSGGFNDQVGRNADGIGDFNGDGIDDIAIGAPFANPAGNPDRGIVYVVYGKPAGSPFNAVVTTDNLNGTNGFRLNGETTSDFLGWALSGVGDVNGDGRSDLLVSGYHQDSFRGAVYLVLGTNVPFAADTEMAALLGVGAAKAVGENIGDGAGYSVSSAGDFNGDGILDVVIGADQADAKGMDSGAIYVVYGRDLSRPTILPGGKIAYFLDTNFDFVTVRTNRGGFTEANFHLAPGLAGAQFELLDLQGNSAFKGAKITITAFPSILGGDGIANLGYLDATGIALGKVVIGGDLGQFDAASALSLTVNSLGAFGLTTQGAINPSLQSDIAGKLNKLIVGTNVTDVTLAASKFGTIKILGDLDGATLLASGMPLAAKARSNVVLSRLNVLGDVIDSQILGGYDAAGYGVLADVQIGTINVLGDWLRSDIAAGVLANDGFFGNPGDGLIGGGGPIVSRIANVIIRGAASGSAAIDDSFGIVAEKVGTVTIGTTRLQLNGRELDDDLFPGTDDFRVREVGA